MEHLWCTSGINIQGTFQLKNSLHILYIGVENGTCLDRANALRRLGHDVTILDTRLLLPQSLWIDRITWKLGGHLLAPLLKRPLTKALQGTHFDVCLVDSGEHEPPSIVEILRKHSNKVINYNIDDPTGPRDGPRFEAYRRSLPYYDLVAVVREENVAEAKNLGAKKVIRVWRSADEVMHAPREITKELHAKWGSDVLFLGTWMPERGSLLQALIEKGINITIRGEHWHKAKEWPILKPYWKGASVHGDDYAYAIQCAKVCIGLVSKGNRDLHTTRSLEIPALGGLLCAERTSEHLVMYNDGIEVLLWSNVDECAEKCRYALEDESRRQKIAEAGHLRYLSNRHANQDIMDALLNNI